MNALDGVAALYRTPHYCFVIRSRFYEFLLFLLAVDAILELRCLGPGLASRSLDVIGRRSTTSIASGSVVFFPLWIEWYTSAYRWLRQWCTFMSVCKYCIRCDERCIRAVSTWHGIRLCPVAIRAFWGAYQAFDLLVLLHKYIWRARNYGFWCTNETI